MTQSLATKGRASASPSVSMSTAGMIVVASGTSASVTSSRGPSLRTTSINLRPITKTRKA